MKKDKEFDKLVMGLIHELGQMDTGELLWFKAWWLSEMECMAMPENVIFLGSTLVDLVIQKKQEKARAAI